MKQKALELLNILKNIFSVLFISIIFVGGATLIYLYANGYSFSLNDNTVKRTGIINFETKPTGARIYINGVDKGETSKIVNYIEEGLVKIKLIKEGYYDIEKEIKVISEKSTPVIVKMIRKQPIRTTIFESENKIIKTINPEYGNKFIIIEETPDGLLEVYRVDTRRNFWDFSPNPSLVYKTPNKNINIEVVSYSNDATDILFKETKTIENTQTKKTTKEIKYVLLNTEKTANNYEYIELEGYINTYKISWTNSNSHIILESKDEIISMDLDSFAKSILYKKTIDNSSVIWNIDTQNNFYVLAKQEKDSIKSYRIDQYNINGGNKKTILDNIYYKTDQSFIDNIKKYTLEYKQFSLSPESTLFVGEIKEFNVLPNLEGIYIKTDYATYWYITKEQKYVVIYNQPAQLVNALGNDKSIILSNNAKRYFIYNINKEESDPITQLGIKELSNIPTDIKDIKWENGNIISFTNSEDSQYIIDKDNENLINILPTNTEYKNILWRTNPSLDDMYSIEQLEKSYRVIKHEI